MLVVRSYALQVDYVCTCRVFRMAVHSPLAQCMQVINSAVTVYHCMHGMQVCEDTKNTKDNAVYPEDGGSSNESTSEASLGGQHTTVVPEGHPNRNWLSSPICGFMTLRRPSP